MEVRFSTDASATAATAADILRRDLVAKARNLKNLTILTDTVVSGLFTDGWVAAIGGNRLYKIRTHETIVAAGSFDQPIVFRNNDRPGILFATAAQRLMRLYGVRPGNRAVIATSNAFGYEAALDMLDAGGEVAAIVDLGTTSAPAVEAARARGIRIVNNATPVDAKGYLRVESIGVAAITGQGKTSNVTDWITCDCVLISVGCAPALNLASHAGAKVVFDEAIQMHRAINPPIGVSLAGSAAGVWSPKLVATQAQSTGATAASRIKGEPAVGLPDITDQGAAAITHPYPIFKSGKGKEFIDFDEDLTVKDIINSVKDGYDDIQLVKRYSTAGLGPSQGRHANLNTIRVVGAVTGKPLEAIGTTTYRPPLVPEKFAHMAGRAFEPTRLTSMHRRHEELGAQFMTAGLWMRPAYYGAKENAARAIEDEVRAVRTAAGLIDVSTLGGLDIRGPDAAAFIDRMYTWAYEKQPVGRARYTLMTDIAGVVIDDGVACRLAPNHYYVTATTSGVDQVYRAMTWFNVQWKMDVDVANVTAAYRNMLANMFNTVAGKRIALFGFAFKADTGDTRESAAIAVARQLLGEHAQVVITDPKALDNARLDLGAQAADVEFFEPDPVSGRGGGAHALAVMTEWDAVPGSRLRQDPRCQETAGVHL